MTFDWESEKKDNSIMLVHLSDLHFGAKHSYETWDEVKDIVGDVGASRLLITGDLIDTPNRKGYVRAKELLDDFNIPYYVCPGNHDRFLKGNRFNLPHLVSSRLVRISVVLALLSFVGVRLAYWESEWNAWEALPAMVVALAWSACLWKWCPGLLAALLPSRPRTYFEEMFGQHFNRIDPDDSAQVNKQTGRAWKPFFVGMLRLLACSGFILSALWLGIGSWHWPYLYGIFVGTLVLGFLCIQFFSKNGKLVELEPIPDTVKNRNSKWDIGFLGTDSNWDADVSARGHVPYKLVTRLSRKTRKSWDLCLFLIHHHLLSMKALERHRWKEYADLLNATCMVNSGSMLESLAQAQIDLVLHGHEHVPNEAIFGSLVPGSSALRVVAAASATGNHSLKGCSIDRASFNIIVLKQDRSVLLVRVFQRDNQWKTEEFNLFNAAELRRSKLRRNEPLAERNFARAISKHVLITHERDIYVYWRFTNWEFPNQEFVHEVSCSSGDLDTDIKVRFSGHPDPVTAVGTRNANQPSDWHIKCQAPSPPEKGFFDWVHLTYHWNNAACLTMQELSQLRNSAPHMDFELEEYRHAGLEYETIWTAKPVISASLVVTLPHGYGATHPQVWVTKENSRNRFSGEETELSVGHLTKVAAGQFSLQVEYPLLRWNYTLAWKPIDESQVQKDMQSYAARFRESLQNVNKRDEILTAVAQALDKPLFSSATIALYAIDDQRQRLQRLGFKNLGRGSEEEQPVDMVSVDEKANVISLSWWRAKISPVIRPKELEPAKKNEDFCANESAVICVPIRYSLRTVNPPPWGVLRIGFSQIDRDELADNLKSSDWSRDNLEIPLMLATTRLLNVVFK